MKGLEIKFYVLVIVSFVLTCFLVGYSMPGSGWAEEKSPPTVAQLAKGEGGGWLPPSIEKLTQGKVKEGDLITKDNVDLVKEYLALSVYECVKKGMVLRMAKNLPPEKIVPRFYWEATAANQGKAIMDKNGTVRLQDGSPWPGGIPFPNPKTPLEAMANTKFGHPVDNLILSNAHTLYVNTNGNIDKDSVMDIWTIYTTSRTKMPTLGAIPGCENLQWKTVGVFKSPLELKGTGQLNIRHYDEYKEPDEGFAYIPAFKRLLRVSATTYQDNVGGSDYTYGDAGGIREPYAYWDFKSINKKLMLLPEPKSPIPFVTEAGKVNSELKFDHGHSFSQLGWAITPTIVIEATPTINHVYGKKVLYMYDLPYYSGTPDPVTLVDIYDRQMKLWKSYIGGRDVITVDGLDYGNSFCELVMYDLQTGHSTVSPRRPIINPPMKADEVNLTKLLQLGR